MTTIVSHGHLTAAQVSQAMGEFLPVAQEFERRLRLPQDKYRWEFLLHIDESATRANGGDATYAPVGYFYITAPVEILSFEPEATMATKIVVKLDFVFELGMTLTRNQLSVLVSELRRLGKPKKYSFARHPYAIIPRAAHTGGAFLLQQSVTEPRTARVPLRTPFLLHGYHHLVLIYNGSAESRSDKLDHKFLKHASLKERVRLDI